MTAHEVAPGRPRRGWPEKREAIVRAARAVFIREGYARASMTAIAGEAGVSNRTIYNHFTDKEELFASIVEESSAAIAADFMEVAERHLGDDVTDVRESLVGFGRAWASPGARVPDHGALVRLLIAEATHFPSIIQVWVRSGPEPVHRELARRLRALAGRGLLRIDPPDDADQAAGHFIALVQTPASNRSFFNALPMDDAEGRAIVAAGVRAFLRVYGP